LEARVGNGTREATEIVVNDIAVDAVVEFTAGPLGPLGDVFEATARLGIAVHCFCPIDMLHAPASSCGTLKKSKN
jgi:hypothetical protein